MRKVSLSHSTLNCADGFPDQLIKLHKSMVETSADASSALARATNDANAALINLQSDFALAQKKFQQQLLHDLEASTDKAQSFLERLVNSMDAALQKAIGKVVSATKDLESVTANLSKVCQSVDYLIIVQLTCFRTS